MIFDPSGRAQGGKSSVKTYEGLDMFNGTNLTLNADVDQDT